MQRSFSIVNDENESDIDKSDDSEEVQSNMLLKKSGKEFKYLDKLVLNSGNDDYDSEENSSSPKKVSASHDKKLALNLSGGSISGRKSVLKVTKNAKDLSSDSEPDLSETGGAKGGKDLMTPKEYNPKLFQNLEVDDEINNLFQFILKYMPQQLNLDYKFKPFVPDYLPAVGDIDAFLKVNPPDRGLLEEILEIEEQQLGLAVLDEPATNQSDPALLHLQLRASSFNFPQESSDLVVKKIDKVEKNLKTIDKWIKDISDLHKSKSSPVVRYSEPMPEVDDLMQEWSEEMEHRLKEHGFPLPENGTTLLDYAELVCDLFQIPIHKQKIHSLHLLFCLYAAVKNSQLYQASNTIPIEKENLEGVKDADQLVLE